MKEYGYVFLIVLYLFSFQYKFSHSFFSSGLFPVGLALGIHGCSLGIFFMSKPVMKRVPLITFFLFSLTIFLSVLYHPRNAYGFGKVILYFLMTAPAYLWGYGVFGPSRVRQQQLIFTLLLFTGFVSITALYQLIMTGRLNTLWGNNYLVLGQSIGIFVILLQRVIVGYNKPWAISGSVGFFLGLLCFNGGRGPLVMTVLTLLIYYGQQYYVSHEKRIPRDCLAVVVGCILFMGLQFLGKIPPPQGIIRTLDILNGPFNDGPVVERLTYYRQAFDLFCAHPITGVGFGLFSQSAGNADISLYPHTIFLEIGCELGLVGLAFFILMGAPFLKAVILFLRSSFHGVSWDLGILLMTVFSALNALKSGDLNDNILLFFSLGVMGYDGRNARPNG